MRRQEATRGGSSPRPAAAHYTLPPHHLLPSSLPAPLPTQTTPPCCSTLLPAQLHTGAGHAGQDARGAGGQPRRAAGRLRRQGCVRGVRLACAALCVCAHLGLCVWALEGDGGIGRGLPARCPVTPPPAAGCLPQAGTTSTSTCSTARRWSMRWSTPKSTRRWVGRSVSASI